MKSIGNLTNDEFNILLTVLKHLQEESNSGYTFTFLSRQDTLKGFSLVFKQECKKDKK